MSNNDINLETRTDEEIKAANLTNIALLQDRLQLLHAIKLAMATPEGKGVLLSLLRFTNQLKNPFTNNGYTAYELGKQSVGLEIIQLITESGHDLKVTDINSFLDIGKIRAINEEILKLTTQNNEL